MWAHGEFSAPPFGYLFLTANGLDLEKRQHEFASGVRKPLPSVEFGTSGGHGIELNPPKTVGQERDEYMKDLKSAEKDDGPSPPGYYE